VRSLSFFVKQAARGGYKLLFFELARRNASFLRFVPLRPIRAAIHVTHNCNSRCITCYAWKERSQDELTTAELSNLLCQLRALGVDDLLLTGGEPLLRDDLPAIVSQAHALKFDRIHLSTNGLLLTRERAEQLIESGVTSVYVSLNGNEQVHDMTRGIKGAYATTVGAIESLVELRATRSPHLEISVSTIVMGLTVEQVVEVARMCRQWGVGLSLAPLDTCPPWEDAIPGDLMIIDQRKLDSAIEELHRLKTASSKLVHGSHTSLEYVRNYFVDRKREDIPCYLGYLKVYVDAHGEVFPGCQVLLPVGNLRQASLKQVVNSRVYKERVHDMFFKRCPGCACDYILNLYAHVPSLVEELGRRLQPWRRR
jgi:MoaA/NifB/PqqE/SkfB family radical SAM enzyme